MNPQTKDNSRILKAVYSGAVDLSAAGCIDNKRLREYALLCLDEAPEYSSNKIKALRRRNKLNQKEFATLLHASVATVRAWERGGRRPSSPYMRLLQVLDRKGIEVFQF